MIEIKDENEFNQQVIREDDLPVIVDFWAPWCGPCQMLKKELANISEAKIVLVDIDECPELANKYSISSLPAVYIYDKGNLKAQFIGLKNAKQIKELLIF
jgi:thioredoxin